MKKLSKVLWILFFTQNLELMTKNHEELANRAV